MKNKHFAAFEQQRSQAAVRGIGWELTFDEWLAFWGDDIGRRGTGRNDLQMQRPCDAGPYAVGNIRKGTPQQNMKTRGDMCRNRRSEMAAKAHQAALDALMALPSAPSCDEDDMSKDEDGDPLNQYSNQIRTSFPSSSDFALCLYNGNA